MAKNNPSAPAAKKPLASTKPGVAKSSAKPANPKTNTVEDKLAKGITDDSLKNILNKLNSALPVPKALSTRKK